MSKRKHTFPPFPGQKPQLSAAAGRRTSWSSWGSDIFILAWSLSWSRVRICWPLCTHQGNPSDHTRNPRKWFPKWSSVHLTSDTWVALRCHPGSCPLVYLQRGSQHKSCGSWTSAHNGPHSLPEAEEAPPPAVVFLNKISLEQNRPAKPIHIQTTAAA